MVASGCTGDFWAIQEVGSRSVPWMALSIFWSRAWCFRQGGQFVEYIPLKEDPCG